MANGLAEIERFASSQDFPECPLSKDGIREVNASWIMYVQKKGSMEAAEAAISKTLNRKEPAFAQMLYPDKLSVREKRGSVQADPRTGQISNTRKQQRDMAALFAATADSTATGGCPGGGSLFAAGGGLSGAIARAEAVKGTDAADGEEWDMDEIKAVFAKIQKANALGEEEDARKAEEAGRKKDMERGATKGNRRQRVAVNERSPRDARKPMYVGGGRASNSQRAADVAHQTFSL